MEVFILPFNINIHKDPAAGGLLLGVGEFLVYLLIDLVRQFALFARIHGIRIDPIDD
jgi:hypothetical protein